MGQPAHFRKLFGIISIVCHYHRSSTDVGAEVDILCRRVIVAALSAIKGRGEVTDMSDLAASDGNR